MGWGAGVRRRRGGAEAAAAKLFALKKGAESAEAGEEARRPFLFGFRFFEPQFLPLGVGVSLKGNRSGRYSRFLVQ